MQRTLQQQHEQQQQQQQHAHHPPATAAPGGAGGEGGSWGLEQHYNLLGKIGEGTYGVVYLATAKQDKKQLYAIKKFKTGREGDGLSPTAIREILLLRELRHEHIVNLTAVHVNRVEPSLSLAFDYAEHDLYEIIWHHRDRLAGPIDPYVVKSLMWQLLNGLSFLHQNWVIHRDLKPSNVLVMGEGPEAGKVKVADFGLARFFQAPLQPLSDNGVVVTIWYRPPELLLGGRHYTRAVDVWGAGCICAELLTLRPLFQGQERKQAGAPFQFDQCDKIFKVLGHPNPASWPLLEALPHWAHNTEGIASKRPEWGSNRLEQHLSKVLKHLEEAFANAAGSRSGAAGQPVPQVQPLTPAGIDLLQRMLEYDPLKRITAEEALNHPWFHEVPLPGPNAFSTNGRRIVSYPRRHKQTAMATGTAPAAMQHQQQQQASQPQQRLHGAASSSSQLQQQKQQPGQRHRGSSSSQQPPPQSSQQQQQQQQQQRSSQQRGAGSSSRPPPSQQQQQQHGRPPSSTGSKKRKAEGQQGRQGEGGHKGGSGSSKDHRPASGSRR